MKVEDVNFEQLMAELKSKFPTSPIFYSNFVEGLAASTDNEKDIKKPKGCGSFFVRGSDLSDVFGALKVAGLIRVEEPWLHGKPGVAAQIHIMD